MSNGVSWHVEDKDGYRVYWSGSHREGDFVQAYAPASVDPKTPPKVVVYLHGFGLCLPRFYAAHLEALAKQGHFAIFPDFQQSDYPDPGDTDAYRDEGRNHFGTWASRIRSLATESLTRRGEIAQYRSRALPNPSLFRRLRVAIAIFATFLLIYLVYQVLDRRYGKNLRKLLSTVGLSLLYRPAEWGDNAVYLSHKALERMAEDYPALNQNPDVVIFGHSLGGLLALSWQSFLSAEDKQLDPKQIFAADPSPNTDAGIPSFAIWILKAFRVPFATNPLSIKQSGATLTKPVTIVHGADDKIVRPALWTEPALLQSQANFDYIASAAKKLYFSLSNREQTPPLIAFHNQAVTDTGEFDDALFEKFGGVKKAPNAYNLQLIWPWLTGVLVDDLLPEKLITALPPHSISVVESLLKPATRRRTAAVLMLCGAVLLGLGYWVWQTSTP